MVVILELTCEGKSEMDVTALPELTAVFGVSERPSDGEVWYVAELVATFVGAELNMLENWLVDEVRVTVFDSDEAVTF